MIGTERPLRWRAVPGARRALLMPSAGREGRRVLGLAGAADWRRGLVDAASAAAVGVFGTRWLPVRRGWSWPTSAPDDLQTALAREVGGLVLLGAVLPRQAGRERLSLLAEADGELAVVKLGRPDTGIEREATALGLLERDPLPCIGTPRVIAHGVIPGGARSDTSFPAAAADGADRTDGVDDVAFLVTTVLGLPRQRAAIDEPLRTFEADLAERLSSLERSVDTPADHVPIHGDLTPWNLRRTPRGLALFDWEEAGWGPPGSDLATYRRASDALLRRHPKPARR